MGVEGLDSRPGLAGERERSTGRFPSTDRSCIQKITIFRECFTEKLRRNRLVNKDAYGKQRFPSVMMSGVVLVTRIFVAQPLIRCVSLDKPLRENSTDEKTLGFVAVDLVL